MKEYHHDLHLADDEISNEHNNAKSARLRRRIIRLGKRKSNDDICKGSNDVQDQDENRSPSILCHDENQVTSVFKTPYAMSNSNGRLHTRRGKSVRTHLSDITHVHSVTSELSIGDGSEINYGKYDIHSQDILNSLAFTDEMLTNASEIDENNTTIRGRHFNLSEEADLHTIGGEVSGEHNNTKSTKLRKRIIRLGSNDGQPQDENRSPSIPCHDDKQMSSEFKTPYAMFNGAGPVNLRRPLSDITQVLSVTNELDRQSSDLFEETEPVNLLSLSQSSISVGGGSRINYGKYVIQSQGVLQSLRLTKGDENNTTVRRRNFNLNEEAGLHTIGGGVSGELNISDQNSYWDIGDPTFACIYCGGLMWYEERLHKKRKSVVPKFALCCMQGKVQLPMLQQPPSVLNNLMSGNDSRSRQFLENIRAYNMMFSFTSMGGKIDTSINNGTGPYIFRLHGQNYHRIGSLLPNSGMRPKFAQLYIYDTENEVENRIQSASARERSQSLDPSIVEDLKNMLDAYNPLAKIFRMARDRFCASEVQNIKIRLIGRRTTDGRNYNLPVASEVAALIVGDIGQADGDRDVIVEQQDGILKRINELHPAYLAMQYPLLLPYAEDGYRVDVQHADTGNCRKRTKLTMREFFAFRIQDRISEANTILAARKLFQQFLVDGYTMIESERLSYIRFHQKELRAEMYKGLTEAILKGETDPSSKGRRVVLPSSFTGGARYMIQNYQDAMAICKWAGYPDLFITFTCNPKWPEIQRVVKKYHVRAEDRPDILCRCFKIKCQQLIKDLKDKHIFGKVKAVIYTIEFQKRGLPHAHILVFLHAEDKYPTAADIDRIICAEIPDKHECPNLCEVVKTFMIHGPCGYAFKNSPCMRDGKCSKFFPKRYNDRTTVDEDGYPLYRRRDDGRTIERNGVLMDNRFVVPYNPRLLMRYQAHINVEWCNQSRSIKYLFKYINKGHDRVTVAFYENSSQNDQHKVIDEINMYCDCRYVSPCEAVWRILSFDIHYREPSVERLSFHLPNEQCIIFRDDDPIETVINRPTIERTMFLAWMEANTEYEEAKQLSYSEFPRKFVWKQDQKKWLPRKKRFSIGRIFYTPPGSGEMYYLRILLNKVKGPTCFEDIRTVDGIIFSTFKEACYARGLLDDDKEYIDGLEEASFWASGDYMRKLFCVLLMSNSLSRPEYVWNMTWHILAEDVLSRQRNLLQYHDLQLSDEQLKNHALHEIEKVLRQNGKTLRDYPQLPFPEGFVVSDGQNMLIQDELRYDRLSLAREHENLFSKLTDEQKNIYETIMTAVSCNEGRVFFLYGYGGTGKTYLWKTLSSAIRSKGAIVLTVASSGIASLLLPGGRTAHSRFVIPLIINENSTCNIKQGSPLAELLIKTSLIIWDEAPMIHKYCFEALDRTLRDLLRFSNPRSLEQPFGGKVVVLGGDFRQILPVIPKGNREDIVFATINSSYLWSSCKVLTLTQNMRLHSNSSEIDSNEMKEFAEWILKIGDGKLGEPNDGEAIIQIPHELLITESSNPLAAIVNSTYPSLLDNLTDPIYLQQRAILAPTHDIVDRINEYMLSLVHGEEKIYLSSDSICKASSDGDSHDDLYTPDFLNSITCSGIPSHVLKLKIGVPVMLLRNIDQSSGLCNGTRLIITQLGNHVIEAQVISGKEIGQKVYIPRMVLTPSQSKWPFKLQRRQYPLVVCFAMTINKSQGQTLSHVGLFLSRPVFTHGQLYVAVSRVTSKNGLKILITDKDGKIDDSTGNVVFKEIFQNLI